MKIRAKIYSPEPLQPVTFEAISDGIDIVLAYMGQIAVQKSAVVTCSLRSPQGAINPYKIAYNKLDKLIELHVVAVPFKQPGELNGSQKSILGIAKFGKGYVAVDVSRDASQIRTTTAHEVGHAFGYVSSGDMNHEDSAHCSDENCLMHPSLNMLITDRPNGNNRDLGNLRKIGQILLGLPMERVTNEYALKQYDFCSNCKADMYETGENHVKQMRFSRLTAR